MSTELKSLKSSARPLVTAEVYSEVMTLNLSEYIEEFQTADGRKIDIEPLTEIVRIGMQKFHGQKTFTSDAWLAPRVHAVLRLFRSEAADMGMWEYLTICDPQLRAYTIWRWGDNDNQGKVKDMKRVWGSERRNALARLWWTAELTRNGPDYTPTADLYNSQNAANYLTDTLMFNNRPAAVAYSRIVRDLKENSTGREDAKETAKTLNHILVTVVLDATAPDSGTDVDIYENWVSEAPDQTLMYNALPQGPNEPTVPEEKIKAAAELMAQIAK